MVSPWFSHFGRGLSPWSPSQVYVGGLDLAVRDADLLKAFERYSTVNSAKAVRKTVVFDRENMGKLMKTAGKMDDWLVIGP